MQQAKMTTEMRVGTSFEFAAVLAILKSAKRFFLLSKHFYTLLKVPISAMQRRHEFQLIRGAIE